MPPATLHESGWTASVGGRIISAGRPTCISTTSAREIDFFDTSARFEQATAVLDDDVCTRPHRPVCLRVRGRPSGSMVRALRKPKSFPADKVFGPGLPTPDWSDVQRECDGASEGDSLDQACRLWLQRYEEELGIHFGFQGLDEYQGRAENLEDRLRWIPAEQRSRGRAKVEKHEEIWGWLADRVVEWQHLRAMGGEAA